MCAFGGGKATGGAHALAKGHQNVVFIDGANGVAAVFIAYYEAQNGNLFRFPSPFLLLIPSTLTITR